MNVYRTEFLKRLRCANINGEYVEEILKRNTQTKKHDENSLER